MTDTTNTKSSDTLRWVMIVGLVLVAFFGAYRFASARGGQAQRVSAGQAITGTAGTAGSSAGGKSAAGASGAACACCGGGAPTANGVTGPPLVGSAVLAGGIQKISVDVTTVYNPNTIKLKAGVPAEITFSQAQGCTQVVQSADLGFSEDLSAGPKTVKLKGLQPGTYAFSCGMQMVFGQIVVE
jgi:plastocyanin